MIEWPLRDLFLHFTEMLKDRAREQYRTDVLVWAILAPYQKRASKPPAIPSILK